MVKSVSEFRSPEKYRKNYIRDGLMEYVGTTGGKPIILQGNIHRGNEGFCGRGYLSNVNPPSTKVEGFQHCALKKAQRLL